MTVEFHDQQGRIFHQEFQKWRRLHPHGYFLTFSAKQRAQLHTTLCWHSGTSDWTYEDFGASLTTKRKICADSYDDLLAWATREGVAVSRCAHCLHEQASVPSLSASPTQAHSVVPHESEDSDTFQDDAVALEGIARETTVITRSRSERLRRAARERAQGICEACDTDFSRILGGLGKRVLQVHHRQQLSLAEVPPFNSIEDLAVVCANCHLMIHADRERAMPVEELRRHLP